VLPEQLNRPTTAIDGRSGDSSDVVVVGELYVHGSPTPLLRHQTPQPQSHVR
jgi:hypothetical protein